jgi:molybdopterin synthase sulfur carrier subunit
MATVWIPSLLRDIAAGQELVTVTGTTLGEVIDQLDFQFPGIKSRLCAGDKLKTGMAAFVGTEVARLGLLQPVEPNSEVHFLPAIGGG